MMTLDACPACTQKKRDKLYTLEDFSVFECSQCGLRYLDPCLSPQAMSEAYQSDDSLKSFHDFYEGYYEYGSLEKKNKTRDDFERALQYLEKRVSNPHDMKVLDVGFGNGYFLAVAQKRGWHVQGIDTSAKNTEMVRSKYDLELKTGIFEEAIPSEPVYDTVSFWDVIEHFPEPHLVLKKAKTVLKPGGYVLIGVPHDKSLLMRLATSLHALSLGCWKRALDKVYFLEHVSYYHLKSLDTLLDACGFERKDLFYSSTDLKKYSLRWHEKGLASIILAFGKLLGMQNRMVAIYQRRA